MRVIHFDFPFWEGPAGVIQATSVDSDAAGPAGAQFGLGNVVRFTTCYSPKRVCNDEAILLTGRLRFCDSTTVEKRLSRAACCPAICMCF